MSLREELDKLRIQNKWTSDGDLLVRLLEDRFKKLENRISYLEDRHPDNCSCNECFTPS